MLKYIFDRDEDKIMDFLKSIEPRVRAGEKPSWLMKYHKNNGFNSIFKIE